MCAGPSCTTCAIASARPPRSKRSATDLGQLVSTGDLEEYESEIELQLYKEYKDVCPMFTYVVETERRFYLCNGIEQAVHDENGRSWVELDLIVRRGAEVVFCEVKSRATTLFGTPAEAVNRDKRQRIRHLAARWIEESRVRPAQIRFDVAAVLGDELEVIEGAF